MPRGGGGMPGGGFAGGFGHMALQAMRNLQAAQLALLGVPGHGRRAGGGGGGRARHGGGGGGGRARHRRRRHYDEDDADDDGW